VSSFVKWMWIGLKFSTTGKPILISPSVHRLYPTVTMWQGTSLEANFGDNLAKPFSFECPNLVLPWML
jgi:hypothetical protein